MNKRAFVSGIFRHEPKRTGIDLQNAIAGHSGDRTEVYKIVGRKELLLSYFYPPDWNPERKYPAFFMIHGGSWSNHGILDDQQQWAGDHLGFLARYFAQRGIVCVSIDYRLMQDLGQQEHYHLIDLYEDCADAVSHVLNHTEENHIDKETMFVLGESAGGYLAGALATFCYYKTFSFRGAFLVNPILDFTEDLKWAEWVPEHSAHPVIAGMTLDERKHFLSPLCQIRSNTCPVVLLHGDSDTLVTQEQSQRFYSTMIGIGRSAQLHILKHTPHAFLLAEYKVECRPACEIAIEVIEQDLAALIKRS